MAKMIGNLINLRKNLSCNSRMHLNRRGNQIKANGKRGNLVHSYIGVGACIFNVPAAWIVHFIPSIIGVAAHSAFHSTGFRLCKFPECNPVHAIQRAISLSSRYTYDFKLKLAFSRLARLHRRVRCLSLAMNAVSKLLRRISIARHASGMARAYAHCVCFLWVRDHSRTWKGWRMAIGPANTHSF